MIYTANLSNLINKLNPYVICQYLINTGWKEYSYRRDFVKIFQFMNGEEFFQVNVPIDKNLNDYSQAMYNVVTTIAVKEKRDFNKVLLYLGNPNSDVLRIRLSRKDMLSGSITLDDAVGIYQNAKKMLSATALDILHPSKYHQGRIDSAINTFLSKCQFGQTEIGSYVVPIVCPFADRDDYEGYRQLSLFTDQERFKNSFTRQVTSKLMNNLYKIKHNIDNNSINEMIDNSPEEIVSANFLEALNGMSLDSENIDVEFIADWCPYINNDTSLIKRITFTHDYYQPIDAIISNLKEDINKSKKIIGRIKKLESSPDAEKRTSGKVTVVYLDENNKSKTVVADLSKFDYDIAINAHINGKHVELLGELSKNAKNKFICQEFSIID